MSDLYCPYCDAGLEVCHDDGFGYSEDVNHEMECRECEKNFTFQTSISFNYKARKADCLNDGEHNLQKVFHVPPLWPDYVRCKDCDYENRGKIREDWESV